MVLKGLGFRLEAPNPLMYVEILLEVLGKIHLTQQLMLSVNTVTQMKVTKPCSPQRAVPLSGAPPSPVPPRPPLRHLGEGRRLPLLAGGHHAVRLPV